MLKKRHDLLIFFIIYLQRVWVFPCEFLFCKHNNQKIDKKTVNDEQNDEQQ